MTPAAQTRPSSPVPSPRAARPVRWCATFALSAALVATLVAATARPALADDQVSASSAASAPALENPSQGAYYYDASALALYGALIGGAAAQFLSVPEQPRFFSPDEGGAERRGDTLPDWTLSVIGGAAFGVVLAAPNPKRWYHVKGFAGAFASTVLVTTLVKKTVGRHRPDYQPTDDDEDGRRSFFSGHSSLTLVSTTYLGLYLRRHLFAGVRPAGSALPWWEAATYLGLAAFSAYVPISRVLDHRHHPSDVAVGSLVGAGVATGFFLWQERRLRRAQGAGRESSVAGWMLTPTVEPAGLGLAGAF